MVLCTPLTAADCPRPPASPSAPPPPPALLAVAVALTSPHPHPTHTPQVRYKSATDNSGELLSIPMERPDLRAVLDDLAAARAE